MYLQRCKFLHAFLGSPGYEYRIMTCYISSPCFYMKGRGKKQYISRLDAELLRHLKRCLAYAWHLKKKIKGRIKMWQTLQYQVNITEQNDRMGNTWHPHAVTEPKCSSCCRKLCRGNEIQRDPNRTKAYNRSSSVVNVNWRHCFLI